MRDPEEAVLPEPPDAAEVPCTAASAGAAAAGAAGADGADGADPADAAAAVPPPAAAGAAAAAAAGADGAAASSEDPQALTAIAKIATSTSTQTPYFLFNIIKILLYPKPNIKITILLVLPYQAWKQQHFLEMRALPPTQ